jgi:hypothetical protein
MRALSLNAGGKKEVPGRASWLPASLLLVASLFGTVSYAFRPSELPGAAVAAVFPPWWSAERSFAAAASTGGAVVRTGAWSNILVVKPGEADLSDRLYAAGAWLLLDPLALDACLKEKT